MNRIIFRKVSQVEKEKNELIIHTYTKQKRTIMAIFTIKFTDKFFVI